MHRIALSRPCGRHKQFFEFDEQHLGKSKKYEADRYIVRLFDIDSGEVAEWSKARVC